MSSSLLIQSHWGNPGIWMVNELHILMVCWPSWTHTWGVQLFLRVWPLILHGCWDRDLTLSSAAQALEAALMWRKLFFVLNELNVPACSLVEV